ncbi:MAG: hypothetical protein EYC62_04660 [Alphaproteobacteria bacterium]|nr:MAG: hypothetical protein EYC62_04660 [Alphaproteobacteria bacterium]
MASSRPITQQHPCGCAVSCAAFVAARRTGSDYAYEKFNGKKSRHRNFLRRPGIIIYLRENSGDRIGHYYARAALGWMDSWANYPMLAAKGGIIKKLPAAPLWIMFPRDWIMEPRANAIPNPKTQNPKP